MATLRPETADTTLLKDPAAYNAAAAPNGRLDNIIGARIAKGELDEFGNEAWWARRLGGAVAAAGADRLWTGITAAG